MSTPINNALNALQTDPFYLGANDVVSRTGWTASPDAQSEFLTANLGNADTSTAECLPVVLSIVGQIRADRFYLATDGLFNPDHPQPWQADRTAVENLLSGTASCLVGPPPASFPEAHAEWPRCIGHMEAIMTNVLPMVEKTGFLTREGGRVVLKFVHKPFEARAPENVLAKPAPQIVAEGLSTKDSAPRDAASAGEPPVEVTHRVKYSPEHLQVLEALDGDREPEFRTINIPAHPRNREAILELAHTHVFNPLCAFMYENRDLPIKPAQYGIVLPGAVVRISFTLSHRLMRRPANVSHFTATINEIEVLHRPAIVSMTPDKALKQKMFLKRPRVEESSLPRDVRKRARN